MIELLGLNRRNTHFDLVRLKTMKLILSRKGFDSAAGKVPSPIFSDNSMVSFPIPDPQSQIRYADIRGNAHASLGELISDLSEVSPEDRAHLDPDLSAHSLNRSEGWRPVFGQTGSAERHLQNNAVSPGDLFLFFGLFRRVQRLEEHWKYVRASRPIHVIFGWLQIAERIPILKWPTERRWATYHPQFCQPRSPLNVMYVSTEYLSLPGLKTEIPGAALFSRYRPALQLTAPESRSSSHWLLPKCFEEQLDRPSLTYHKNQARWSRHDDGVLLSSAGRGQEFVLDCDKSPGVISWITELVREAR